MSLYLAAPKQETLFNFSINVQTQFWIHLVSIDFVQDVGVDLGHWLYRLYWFVDLLYWLQELKGCRSCKSGNAINRK